MAESTSDDRFRSLQREIRESIRRNHPNPDRNGCLGGETLRKMAAAAIPPGDPGYRHVMECSPCYEELMEFTAAAEGQRLEDASRRRRQVLMVVFTLALLSAGIGAYVLMKLDAPQSRQRPDLVANGISANQQLSKGASTDRFSVAMLNLDSETSVRSNGGERRTTELQRLPRLRLALTINLPRGLEEGSYELAFSRDDGPPLLTLAGQARIEGGLTVLHIQADLSGLSAGQYNLRIRREGSAWRESQILLF